MDLASPAFNWVAAQRQAWDEGDPAWTTSIEDEVYMPHGSPAPLVGRRPSSCDEAIRHAAQDSTALYIALLPREIRDAIDSLLQSSAYTWLHSGMLKRLELNDSPRGSDGLVRVVSAEGEQVLIYGTSTAHRKARSTSLIICAKSRVARARSELSCVSRACRALIIAPEILPRLPLHETRQRPWSRDRDQWQSLRRLRCDFCCAS